MKNSEPQNGDAPANEARTPAVYGWTLGAIAAWIALVGLMQWMLYGPHLDLERLTRLPLNFILAKWLPLLRDLLSAPLGS